MTTLFKSFRLLAVLCVSLNVHSEITPKILGGTSAAATAWPWMSALVLKNTTSSVFCGGTLVAPTWVLTAAHCLFDESPTQANQYIPTDLSTFDILINHSKLSSSATGERITPASVVVHPGFNRTTLINDIALIKLSTASTTPPIETLPDFSLLDEAGQNEAIALGWGNTSSVYKRFPSTLQQVTLPIISNAQCSKSLTNIEDFMLCAGLANGGYDTCEGDSGGPLVVFDAQKGTWRQAGITSFGEQACGTSGFYGVYTRLDMFKSFISNTICQADQKPATPSLTLTTDNTTVTAKWSLSTIATGYRLNYAPYPSMTPITSIELNQTGQLSLTLPKGSAFYVAVNAYNNNCRSDFSTIEHFTLQ